MVAGLPVPPIEISLLGRFAVRRDGEEVPPTEFGGRLPRRLVRFLLASRGSFVSRDVLVDALWGERPPSDPDANLNVLVNRARQALGDPALIVTEPGGYRFRAGDDCVVDAEQFLAQVNDGSRHLAAGRPAEALVILTDALDRWWDSPLPEDVYEPWSHEHRVRLERAHLDALERAAEAALATGAAREAAQFADRATAAAPLHEPVHLLLMRALTARGDPAGALRAYGSLRQRLREELGVEPSPALQRLHRTILRGDAASGVGGDAAETEPTAPAPTDSRVGDAAVHPRADDLPFVGRARELDLLRAALRGGAPPVLVAGPAGTGKTRLLAEVARSSRAAALEVRAVLPEQDVPWSVTRALVTEVLSIDPSLTRSLASPVLAALASLVPGLAPSPLELDPDSQSALITEGVHRLLSGGPAARALVVDDLHWADRASLDLLARLRARLDLPMVLAYRPEEVAAGSPVHGLLQDVRRLGETATIELGPLPEAAIARLCEEPLATVVLDGTDRTPFALTVALRDLTGQGLVIRAGGGRYRLRSPVDIAPAAEVTRAGYRRSIGTRVDQQPSERRTLLTMLALLNRDAPARILAVATGRSQADVLDDLDALARAGLGRHTERGWAPAHDLIGETVRAALDPRARARSHARLGSALHDEGADPGEAAAHLLASGDQMSAAAAYASAARLRLDRAAHREAVELADRGLALEPGGEVGLALLELRAEGRAVAGDLPGARADLRAALTGTSSPDRSRLLVRIAQLALGAEDLARAAELVDLALVAAGHDPGSRARALGAGSVVDMNLQRWQRAAERADEALALYHELGDARGAAAVLEARAMAGFLGGQLRESIAAFDRAAHHLEDTGQLVAAITPRSTRGHALLFAGRAEEGRNDVDEALQLARDLHHPEGEAFVRWHRSEVLTELGAAGPAEDEARRALSLAESLDHRGWTATALTGLGVALEAQGRLEEAGQAHRRSLEASTGLPLFSCWGAARLARVLILLGHLGEAEGLVLRARREGPPLGQFEARLAEAELALARRTATADAVVAEALEFAERHGHEQVAARLRAHG